MFPKLTYLTQAKINQKMRNQLPKLGDSWMTETIVEEERSFCGSASGGTKRRAEVKEAFLLMSYANRLPRTPVLQGYRVV